MRCNNGNRGRLCSSNYLAVAYWSDPGGFPFIPFPSTFLDTRRISSSGSSIGRDRGGGAFKFQISISISRPAGNWRKREEEDRAAGVRASRYLQNLGLPLGSPLLDKEADWASKEIKRR